LATAFASTACVSNHKKDSAAPPAGKKPVVTIFSKSSAKKAKAKTAPLPATLVANNKSPVGTKKPAVLSSIPATSLSAPLPYTLVSNTEPPPVSPEGTWYEVARLNHRAERGLTRESIILKPISNNRWLVVHRGWRNETGSWEERSSETSGAPSSSAVMTAAQSFQKAFPASVEVVLIDKTYRYVLVCQKNRRGFWILSKDENPSHSIVESLLAEAKSKGLSIEEALFLQY
jgi:apolipoprotein D and lipocalin family protein